MRHILPIIVVLAALLAGFAVAEGWRLSVPGASAGDWLGFGGAMAGAFITIMGAVGIEDWKRRQRDRSDLSRLRDALKDVAETWEGIAEAAEMPLADREAAAPARFDKAAAAATPFMFIAEQARIPSVALWQAVHALAAEIQGRLNSARIEFAVAAGHDEAGALVHIANGARSFTGQARAAMKMIDEI